MLFNILFFTFLASIVSLFLVAVLLLHKTLIKKISFPLLSFATGAMLATAFLDTLKEALNLGGSDILLWVVLSFAGFFIIERAFLSLHHHEEEGLRLPASLLLFGDALHNFIDGASIAAGFLVSFPLGLITSLAVFVHEIPHELGDFGILIHKGWGRGRVLAFNGATGLAAFAGAIVGFYLGSQFDGMVPILLAITTGNFIYLSATDLLPEIHENSKKSQAFANVTFFFLGIVVIILLTQIIGS